MSHGEVFMGVAAENSQKAFTASVKKRYIPGFKKEMKTVSFRDFRTEMKKHGIDDISLNQFNDFMKNNHPEWFKSKNLENTYYE
ncbi:hypothetical protein WCT90_12045 [Pectobacterium carotovorum]|uniref:hypothetical protein n=1 Tax=Pectobacterium carotovorum TaxID=554 RepID=UPI00301B5F27